MYEVSVWSLKLEIGFLPLFLRSYVALCFFLSRSDGLVFRHLVLWCAAAGIVASGFTVVCRWPSFGCRLYTVIEFLLYSSLGCGLIWVCLSLLNCRMHNFDCTTCPVAKQRRFFIPPLKCLYSLPHKRNGPNSKSLNFPKEITFKIWAPKIQKWVHVVIIRLISKIESITWEVHWPKIYFSIFLTTSVWRVCLSGQLSCSNEEGSGMHVGVRGKIPLEVLIFKRTGMCEVNLVNIKTIIIYENMFSISIDVTWGETERSE